MDTQSTAQVLTEFFGYARDLSVVGFIILVAWKARGMWDTANGFIESVQVFMKAVTGTLHLLVNNHLKHLQESAARVEHKLDDQTELLQDIKNRQ